MSNADFVEADADFIKAIVCDGNIRARREHRSAVLHTKLLETVEYLNQTEDDKKEANRGFNEAIKGAKARIVKIARCLKTGEVFEPEGLGLDDE